MSWRAPGSHSIVVAALLGVVLVGGMSVGAQGAAPAFPSAMEEVASCAECHDLERPGFTENPHGVLNEDPALARRFGVSSSCSGCHGEATLHIEAGGGEGTLFDFAASEPALVRSERCLDCHGGLSHFVATGHSAAGLACTDCHRIHGDDAGEFLLAIEPAAVDDPWSEPGEVTTSCASCHAEVLAEFRFNERHRLEKGILDCASCHDPHEPEVRTRLAGFDQDGCVDCHTRQGGPFVFEHGAQRVDGCGACHRPHGSPNRHLLTFQRVADLCYSCHLVVPGSHLRFSPDTVCTNCHSTIHGSNFDIDFLR